VHSAVKLDDMVILLKNSTVPRAWMDGEEKLRARKREGLKIEIIILAPFYRHLFFIALPIFF